MSMILVGNKCDLEEHRQVSYEEGKNFAKDNGMKFFETSAKISTNVENLFHEGAEMVNEKIE